MSRPHASLRYLASAALVAVAVAVMMPLAASQDADPAITFESPLDNSYVSGSTTIRVGVALPGVTARSVSLFADGTLVCTRERPPFECAWNAGSRVAEHVLRATVLLSDGRHLARSIRTRGVEYTESVDVDVVQITATVTAGRGQFIRGLTRGQFEIYEDGVRQEITSFGAEDTPLEVVVAVDFSGSMTPAMPTVKAALKKFLASLRPADRVTLLAFNDSVFTLAPPTANLSARLRAIDRLRPWGGTALYDVIIKAAGELGTQAGRRALVVFSDGEDRHSKAPLEATEGRLETSDAVLYAIGQGRANELLNLRRILERLAAKSGGRAFFEDLNGLDQVFHDIVADLSNQYVIGYSPKDTARDGRWRDLRIEVPGTDFHVRARRGYRTVEK